MTTNWVLLVKWLIIVNILNYIKSNSIYQDILYSKHKLFVFPPFSAYHSDHQYLLFFPCYQMAPKQKIRIKLRSYWVPLIEDSCKQIMDAARTTNAKTMGPVPLPTKKRIYCVLKSPHVHKDARFHFEIRTHQRLIDILYPTAQTIDSLMQLDLPAGVDVEVKLWETMIDISYLRIQPGSYFGFYSLFVTCISVIVLEKTQFKHQWSASSSFCSITYLLRVAWVTFEM